MSHLFIRGSFILQRGKVKFLKNIYSEALTLKFRFQVPFETVSNLISIINSGKFTGNSNQISLYNVSDFIFWCLGTEINSFIKVKLVAFIFI